MVGRGVVDKGELGKEWPDQLGEMVELLGRVCLDEAYRERDPLAHGAPSIFDQSPGGTVNAEGASGDWWSGERKGKPSRSSCCGERTGWHDRWCGLPGIVEWRERRWSRERAPADLGAKCPNKHGRACAV
jgi:hypothetical protein